MSKYTSVLIFTAGIENEQERIKEIQAFQHSPTQPFNIRYLNDTNQFPDIFPKTTFAGTYNYLDKELFLSHIKHKVNWKFPEYVQIFIMEEDCWSGSFYVEAGNRLAFEGERM